MSSADVTAELTNLIDEFFGAVSFGSGETNSSDSPVISTVDEFIAVRQSMFDAGALAAFEEVDGVG